MFSTLHGKMSLMVFGLILICCHARTIIETYDHIPLDEQVDVQATKVEKFLENFKIIMKTGNESLGIPVLDPFTLDDMPFEINEDIVKLKGRVSKVKVDGLSNYKVVSGDFQLLRLRFSMALSWPLVAAVTDYEIKGNVDSFEIFGKGKINMKAQDFSFATDVDLVVSGKYLKVKKVASKVSLKKLDFKITGLFDDEETSDLASSLISDMVPKMIDEYQDDVTKEINAVIAEKLGEFLADKTIADLIKIFG